MINTSPRKRPTFDTRDNARVLTKQKLYSSFKISQVVADPFIALAFIFSPFGIKHQNRINLGPLTPLPHQILQLRANR
jgi:tetrahydromethanopterin S-methyltransferase subunit C